MRKTFFATLCALAFTLSASIASATPFSFAVSIDTAPLAAPGAPAGPYWLDFLLLNGALDPLSNSVIVSGFSSAGSLIGPPVKTGGVTGDLTSSVTLTDSGFQARYYQQFTPGGVLSFLISLNPVFGGSIPDSFSFAILRGNDSPPLGIPTTDVFGTLLSLDINGTTLSIGDVHTFEGLGDFAGLVAVATPVPEPTSLLLLGVGLLVAARHRARRK